MSRPLVIKITQNDLQPRNKSTGSINVEILRANETKLHNETHNSNSLENLATGSSLVRSLISKYESGNSPTLVKYRSKSMVDLSHEQKPKSDSQQTQDDFLYHRNSQNDEGEFLQEWKENFKHAMSKFQQVPDDTAVGYKRVHFVGDVRERAKQLLEATKHDYFWFNDVMELLQHIVNGNDIKQESIDDIDGLIEHQRNHDAESLDIHGEDNPSGPNSSDNFDEIKQNYEEQPLASNENLHFENKSQQPKTERTLPLKYFGIEDKEIPLETEEHLDDYRIKQLSRASNDNDLLDSETFEDEDNFEAIDLNSDVVEAQILVPPEHHEALLTVEKMMEKIEECDKKIDNITFENHVEANRLNEMLIQVLVKLDDLRTYDDGVIVTMRNRAFAFTQDCIQKLKDKVFGDAN